MEREGAESQKVTVGVLGLGSFGRFVVSHLTQDPDLRLVAYDNRRTRAADGAERVDFNTVVEDTDVLVLAVPLNAYPKVLPRVAKRIRPETLILDVCSVKVYPEEHINQHLPDHPNVLMTHPLFGPQSAAKSMRGHTLIVTKAQGGAAEGTLRYFTDRLGLNVQHMSAADHDKLMAKIHVLTFFVARGLSNLNLDNVPFVTPSYRMITDLVRFDRTHTEDLFQTIQSGNPYADQIRMQLIASFQEIEQGLLHEQ